MSASDFHHNFDQFFDNLPMKRGRKGAPGYWRLQPRPDMELVVSDFDIQQEQQIRLQPASAMVELNFLFQGSREVAVSGTHHEAATGSCTLEFVTPGESRLGFAGASRFQMLSIGMSVDAFQRLLAGGYDESSPDFSQIVGKRSFRAFQIPYGPNAAHTASRLLEKIQEGKGRNVELEWLMLELLLEAFRSCLFDERPQQIKLSAGDCEKLYDAKRIMQQNMADPPTLLELARMIGMNDYKLKAGFKEMYGTTVFGYLRDYRLEQAMRILQRGGRNVSETACAVGYSNPSYFAEAFREKYGINPRELNRPGSMYNGKN